MAFVVKNISGGVLSLDDIGITLAIGEEYNLVEEQGNEVATSEDLLDAINAADAVFLDPLDDVTELSLAESLNVYETINNPNYRIFGGELDQLDDVNLTAPTPNQVLVAIAGSPAGSPTPIKWINQTAGAASDQLVRVTASDTTSGFLASKLVIESPATISLTVKNPAGNETLAIDLDAELDDLNDVNSSAATSGQVLTFTGSPPTWQGRDSTVGLSVQGIWRFRTETAAADPGAGRFRYNNATPASITAIYIDQFTDNGVDAQTILSGLQVGQQMYIQQSSDSGAFLLITITSVTDNTGWFTIGVTVDSSGTLPTNNAQCGFLMLFTVETAQNLFETFNADSGSVTASSINAQLTFAGGVGITTTIAGSPQTLTIDFTPGNSGLNAFETILTDEGSPIVAVGPTDTIALLGGTGGIETRVSLTGSPQVKTVAFDISTENTDGSLFELTFESFSSVGDDWLTVSGSTPSNETPFVLAWDCILHGLTFSNKESGVSTDLEIYRVLEGDGDSPSELMFTWQINSARTARRTTFGSPAIFFSKGDKVAVFAATPGGGGSPSSVTDPSQMRMLIQFLVTNSDQTENQEDWSGNIST